MSAEHTPAAGEQSWVCPDCSWTHAAHPTYGWSAQDARAVEVHRAALCPWRTSEPCRFGYEEHDGARYCFEHGGFLEAGVQSRRCDGPARRAEQIAAIEHTQHHHPTHIDIRTNHGEEPPERIDSPRDPDGLLEENRRERQWRWFE